jgi:hypothetical protein
MGEPVRYQPLTWDAFRALGFPGSDDLGNMFQFYHDFADEVMRTRDLEATRRLNPDLQTFARWLELHGSKIPKP